MPGQINSVPVGLLDLLGIQSQGTNPGALSDFVQSTLDLSNLYLTWKRRNLVDSTFFGAAATSSVVLATVPANEYWYLLGGALVNLSAPAATGSAYLECQVGGTTQYVSNTLSVAYANLNSAAPIGFGLDAVLMPPGSVITKYGYGLAAAGNERMNVRLNYVPLLG